MIIAANWKMHDFTGGTDGFAAFTTALSAQGGLPDGRTLVVCPPAILLQSYVKSPLNLPIDFGGQDCSIHADGAYTGEVSAAMLVGQGAKYCILGHSERRQYHHECNGQVALKAQQAQAHALVPIICIGEMSADMSPAARADSLRAQTTESVANVDLDRCVLAYEPVWAIGTGLIPKPRQIADSIATIKAVTDTRAPVLYGGSVNAHNAAQIFGINGVDGALIGGASLQAQSLLNIINAPI